MIPALSAIVSEYDTPTKNTMKQVKQFLDYTASQEEVIITFNASGMVLAIHYDASYPSKKMHAVAQDAIFPYQVTKKPPPNDTVLNLSTIIRNVIS